MEWPWYNKRNKKKHLMKTLVFPIVTYGLEIWTINASCRRTIESFEMKLYRKIMRVPWTAYKTNASILDELNIQENRRLALPSMQRQILKLFGYVIRQDGLEKIIIQEKVQGIRNKGRPPIRFIDQIKYSTDIRSVTSRNHAMHRRPRRLEIY